jgi:hypothetical protein
VVLQLDVQRVHAGKPARDGQCPLAIAGHQPPANLAVPAA